MSLIPRAVRADLALDTIGLCLIVTGVILWSLIAGLITAGVAFLLISLRYGGEFGAGTGQAGGTGRR